MLITYQTGGVLFIGNILNYLKIPGNPIAYWVKKKCLYAFSKGIAIEKICVVRNGLKTGDNNEFVRCWFEVSSDNTMLYATDYITALHSGKKWFPYNKGGEYRKWFGNNEYVVNWKDKGYRVIQQAKFEKRNVQDYPDAYKFLPIITWSLITSYKPSFRYKRYAISDICGMSMYGASDEKFNYYLGFVNSEVALYFLQMFNPTLNFQAGDIGRLPLIECESQKIGSVVDENISLSKHDWDSFETSWDFKKHPLI